jgi:hypothetical protein
MTDQQYQDWLNDPTAKRVVLIEATVYTGGQDVVRYLSTAPYNTGSSDVPANIYYQSILASDVKFTETIAPGTTTGISAGSIDLYNVDGSIDSWLNDIWTNKSLVAFIGDIRWPRSDFRSIFNGVSAGIDSRDLDTLSISMRDKLQRLNTPVSDTKLIDTRPGDTSPNKDSIIPLVFGEVHNVTPLLVNPATLEYQINNGPVEGMFEVRDNGIPISATVANTTGKFTLPASPAGAITVSVQGDKSPTYINTVADIIKRIVTGFGKVSDRFSIGDIDTANFAAFNTAHPQPVGLYLQERTNVLTACQQLASSIGAEMIPSRTGLLRLIQISLPAVGTPTAINDSNKLFNTLKITDRSEVVAAVKLNFCKNYTLQPGLLTGIPAQHKDMYAEPWLSVTASDATVNAAYKLNLEPIPSDTLLLTYADANAEATRRLNLYKVQRTVYTMECTASMLSLELGQAVTLYDKRYGLSGGVLGMVVALTPSWIEGKVTVEVMI